MFGRFWDNKPTPQQIAYQHGYGDYVDGKDKSANPFQRQDLRNKWDEGWEAARQNNEERKSNNA